jgi:hypothetical protein
MTFIDDDNRLQAYLARLAAARSHRAKVVELLVEAIGNLGSRLLELEEQLSDGIERLKSLDAARQKATHRIWLQWEPSSSVRPLGPVGPTWFISSKNEPPRRLRRPTRRLLDRAFRSEFRPDLIAIVESVTALRAVRDAERERLGRLFHILKDELGDMVPAIETEERWAWATERIAMTLRDREGGIRRLEGGVMSVYQDLVGREWEMDQLMIAFNEQGRRRNNALTVNWRPVNTTNTIAALRGPFFSQLRIGGRGGRYLQQVKPGGVNRDLVRACFQNRFEGTLIPLARKIEKLAGRRKELIARLVNVQRALGLHIVDNDEGDS